MKVTILISTIDTQLDELGVDQEPIWVPLHFKSELFIGYWIIPEEDESEIMFYVGAVKFITPNKRETVELFESFLK